MNIKDHLKFKATFSSHDEEIISAIQNKLESSTFELLRLEQYIKELLDIIHRGLAIDQLKFLNNVFFDFYVIRKNTEPHLARIYEQLRAIRNYEEDSEAEQTHLVNIYRNIVSDAFDPYLNLVVASLQFIEGNFVNIQQTNLGLGERQKYEYAFSRLKPTNVFEGYSPVVRNAISHSGSEGIIYEPGKVVFRSIKRGVTPKIEFEPWTNDTLRYKILQLMDFIIAIDNCIEIVGFDASEIIMVNNDLSGKFFDEILTTEHRLDIHNDLDKTVQKILALDSIDYGTKLKALTSIFMTECKKRNIPVNSLSFNNEKRLIRIEVPFKLIDLNIENEMIDKAIQLTRYGIIAVLLFNFHYEIIEITEPPLAGQDYMSVKVKSEELEAYAKEQIGLVDVLNDCDIYLNGNKMIVTADFEKLKALQYSSTDRRFPLKAR